MDPGLTAVIKGCLALDTNDRWAAHVVCSNLIDIITQSYLRKRVQSGLQGASPDLYLHQSR